MWRIGYVPAKIYTAIKTCRYPHQILVIINFELFIMIIELRLFESTSLDVIYFRNKMYVY